MDLKKLKGMSDDLAAALKAQGVNDGDALLAAGKTRSQRTKLAKELGIEARALLELCNRADLSRVKGVGGVYSDLLEAAGVDTVKELATRRPDNLHAKIVETNDKDQLTPNAPAASMVEEWVKQAKGLDPIIEY